MVIFGRRLVNRGGAFLFLGDKDLTGEPIMSRREMIEWEIEQINIERRKAGLAG